MTSKTSGRTMKTQIENFTGIINHCDERWLKEVMTTNLQKAEFSILDFVDYQFDKFGYTALWLLGESHLAIHTFPENNNAYIELSSCLPEKGRLFWENIQKELVFEQKSHRRTDSMA